MRLQGELERDAALWLLGSLCGRFRIPFDAALIAQSYPPPYTLLTLHEAARALGLKTGHHPLAGSEWPTLPFPLIAFAAPETPDGLDRESAAVTLILDFPFLLIFLAVMFAYDRRESLWDSWQLSLIAVGLLVAFQMFASRMSQPMLRLVGLWQELQQANVAVKRLGENERKRVSVKAHMSAANVMP